MDSDDTPPRQWLNATQAAEYLGVSRATLYRRVDDGDVTVHRTPRGRPRYDRAELDVIREQETQERTGYTLTAEQRHRFARQWAEAGITKARQDADLGQMGLHMALRRQADTCAYGAAEHLSKGEIHLAQAWAEALQLIDDEIEKNKKEDPGGGPEK